MNDTRVEPMSGARQRALVAAGGVAAIAVVGVGAVSLPSPPLRSVDLIAALPDAEIRTTWPSLHAGVSRQAVLFGRVVRPSIVAMPTSTITWTIDVPPRAVLRTGAAMRPDMWERLGDGIQMFVTIERGATRTQVAALTLFTAGVLEHRQLIPIAVDLGPWAGQRVRVEFEATPERWGNAVNDVPVWVEPRIEWSRNRGGAAARVVRRQ